MLYSCYIIENTVCFLMMIHDRFPGELAMKAREHHRGGERVVMTEQTYNKFVHEHLGEIVEKIIELDNFTESDISMIKSQILSGINRKKRMPVLPMDDLKGLMVGYFAIKFIEDELGFTF